MTKTSYKTLYMINTYMQNRSIIMDNLRLKHPFSEEPAVALLQARRELLHLSPRWKVT